MRPDSSKTLVGAI